uniref:PDZ domain-containing protein n=1 Tax=Strongyloides venezuelensis TaxID=75913 RepID=A0A0K0EU07_STRVS
MSVFYPSLEDMTVDQYIMSQRYPSHPQPTAPTYYYARESDNPVNNGVNGPIYEAINNDDKGKNNESGRRNIENMMHFGGSQFTPNGHHNESIVTIPRSNCEQQNVVPWNNDDRRVISSDGRTNNDAIEQLPNGTIMIAPISMLSNSLSKSVVHHGVRTTTLYKEKNGKVGIRLRCIDMGMFVQFVAEDSPAAIGGIRFGDQILEINGVELLGLSEDEAMDLLNPSKEEQTLDLVIRDRPFERTITLHKNNVGSLGFGYADNKITHIIKNTSASRNGLLINQRILEVNGQNVIGFKSPQMKQILDEAEQTVTLTIISNDMYNALLKNVSWSLILKKQDHSIPE